MRGKSRATDAPCRTIHEWPVIATQCPQLLHGILFEKYGPDSAAQPAIRALRARAAARFSSWQSSDRR